MGFLFQDSMREEKKKTRKKNGSGSKTNGGLFATTSTCAELTFHAHAQTKRCHDKAEKKQHN